MNYRELGRTGLKVSAVSMGGIPIQRIDFKEAAEVVKIALEKGINFIDTARAYTDSEEKLGKALSACRDKVYLATKAMSRTKTEMARDIDISLEKLKTDYIDLYQLHNVKDNDNLKKVLAPGGALEALKDAQKAGKVRFIGITGHIPSVLVNAVKTGEFDTVQFPFNPVETSGGDELLPLAKEMNIGTIAMKPFAGGAIQAPVLSIRFILEQGLSTVIPGMDDVKQVEQNISAANGKPLTEEERRVLAQEISTLGARFCRRCEYCQPCPQGIEIPTIFLLEGYWSRYGLKEWAVNRYKPMQAKASDCIECGNCEKKCPYQLPIMQMLKEAAARLES